MTLTRRRALLGGASLALAAPCLSLGAAWPALAQAAPIAAMPLHRAFALGDMRV